MYLLKNSKPSWLEYPDEYLRIVEQGLVNLDPWFLIEADQIDVFYRGLKNRYSDRDLFPFAHYKDDTVACWEKGEGAKVVLINGCTTPGHETIEVYTNFWDWFRSAIEDMIEHEC